MASDALGDDGGPRVTEVFREDYRIDGDITGRLGQARVRTVWIIPRGTAAPQLVTAYPAPGEGK